MRRKNWRVVIAGVFLIVMALVFFVFMLSIASRSNDPVALFQTVGTVVARRGHQPGHDHHRTDRQEGLAYE